MSIVLNVHPSVHLCTGVHRFLKIFRSVYNGPKNTEHYRHIVQVLLGLGRDTYALNPYDACTSCRKSGPIHYLPCHTLLVPQKVPKFQTTPFLAKMTANSLLFKNQLKNSYLLSS